VSEAPSPEITATTPVTEEDQTGFRETLGRLLRPDEESATSSPAEATAETVPALSPDNAAAVDAAAEPAAEVAQISAPAVVDQPVLHLPVDLIERPLVSQPVLPETVPDDIAVTGPAQTDIPLTPASRPADAEQSTGLLKTLVTLLRPEPAQTAETAAATPKTGESVSEVACELSAS